MSTGKDKHPHKRPLPTPKKKDRYISACRGYRSTDTIVGRIKISCPSCGHNSTISSEGDMSDNEWSIEKYTKKIKLPVSGRQINHRGKTAVCPKCGRKFELY